MEEEEISFTDFIASTIHDMKNSLNMQIASLEKIAAQSQQKGDTPTADQLGNIIYEANRMNGNLVQLLSLYKLRKSIYPMDISEHSVREVIEEATLQDKSIREMRKLDLILDCDEDCYWYFDRDLVTGILINALNNAYKYTRDKIRLSARIDNDYLEIRVEDNGSGYPSPMLRSGVGSSRSIDFIGGSTGLGFYFSDRVAKTHKNGSREGTLIIENGGAYGGGCFVVRLP